MSESIFKSPKDVSERVNQILEHIQDLEAVDAECVMGQAYFSVIWSIAEEYGITDVEQIKATIVESFRKFAEVNTLVITKGN